VFGGKVSKTTNTKNKPQLVLEGPVSRPVQDRKKTGPRPVFNKDCSIGLSNFKTKDCKKTGPYGLA